ncbi:glycosyltransferase family 4 protein [Desulfallas thermosapovorans]|uniref:Glycosyltransferase involved in cell wall biosynthesis n=1 Tax=Desulfallas thermosapovorans DSM 6562 TaxID=1121431 RepID=A0A5S4ZUG7_9FIRM|nr:glycosyltransferase family 4 protein [Desulfallas thermosapovorans]TYO96442.1 glycosyltransferase involved in cell wall biosynthesis [Desulfallas thermosapovorans DSM 6562]
MPRLWILNHYAVGPNESGGTRHLDLAGELVQLGWEVAIFAASFNHQTHSEAHLAPGETIKEEYHNGVRFVWLKTAAYQDNGRDRVLNMLEYTRRVMQVAWNREKPDMIIGSSVHLLAVLAAYWLARHHRCPFFFEVRDLWPQVLIDIGKISERHPVIRLLRKLEVFLYRKADGIIILLPGAGEYITRFGIPGEKIFYLPNGVNLSRYNTDTPPLGDELEKILAGLSGKFIAVYTGTHGIANGLDTILDAAGVLKRQGDTRVHFLLVGNGPEKPRLQDRAAREHLDNVTFVDPVAKEYVPSLLKRVNTGLHSFQDSPVFQWGVSPNKIFDYMAAGLPVIFLCDRAGGNPVDLSGGGVVLPGGNVEALVQALLEMVQHPDRAAQMGKKARQYVEAEHASTVLGRRLAAFLQRENQTTAPAIYNER